MNRKDRIRACLLGGAAGDALSYAIEFMDEPSIDLEYGPDGIQTYELNENQLAEISDDTQMSLFTAAALIEHPDKIRNHDIDGLLEDIRLAYLDWYTTQIRHWKPNIHGSTKLVREKLLYNRRAPGTTCLTALRHGGTGTLEQPINDSKGCGGIMRTAPIALALSDVWDAGESSLLAARAAALTHGHPSGWLPCAALNYILCSLLDGEDLISASREAAASIRAQFPEYPEAEELASLIEKTIAVSKDSGTDLEGIHSLGEGWTGDEALAIGLFCALRHPDDIEKGILASVNHRGDSDSTGAITGQILGAATGSIPEKCVLSLEGRSLLENAAADLRLLN